MTKAEIVTEIAGKTGIEKKDVLNTIEAFMEVVKESLSKEENVYLRGFGSFIVKKSVFTETDIHEACVQAGHHLFYLA